MTYNPRIYWLMHDNSGRIHMVGHGDSIPPAYTPEWTVVEVPERATLDMWFDLSEGVAKDRVPVGGPLPEAHSLTVNEDWVLADIPEGTEVKVDGEVVGTVDNTGLTLSFSAAGVWQVKLLPPFPWLEASCEVTVT